jgi:hypothetical protein
MIPRVKPEGMLFGKPVSTFSNHVSGVTQGSIHNLGLACDNNPWPLERFRAKWVPVRVKKTRQNKKLEPPFRFNRNGGSSCSWQVGIGHVGGNYR